jgi:hypothetical protein
MRAKVFYRYFGIVFWFWTATLVFPGVTVSKEGFAFLAQEGGEGFFVC